MGPPPNALPGDGGLSHAQRCINTGRFISYILSPSDIEISYFLIMCRTYTVIFSSRILYCLFGIFIMLIGILRFNTLKITESTSWKIRSVNLITFNALNYLEI